MAKQAVAARWAAVVWFCGLICTWQLQEASPLRSATCISKHAGANQIAIRCSYVSLAGQRAVAAIQPAGWCRPTACGRTDGLEVTAPHFWKNAIIFVMTIPIDIKPSTCPAHGRYASACKISPSYDAAFRRR